MFVTCLYGLLDPITGMLRFSNAGHNLPIKKNRSELQELRATGMPLGMLPEMTYEEKIVSIQPGEQLFLFTDGIVEAHNPQREMFGTSRLKACLIDIVSEGSVIDNLLARLSEFVGSEGEQEDDITIVSLACEQSA
jgi:serine phosphatase RsbU (regulator of sigma subunit)